MPVVQPRHILSGMLVKEAMRRQVVQLPVDAPITAGINHLLKFKVNAVLITDSGQRPAGVVSKTDLIGAFYAQLPIDTPLGDIMIRPPLTCYPDDPIESALDRMRHRGVHRLYVTGAEAATMIGTLSYTDVVALLYRYCRACPKSTSRRNAATEPGDEGWRLRVQEVMTSSVMSFPEGAALAQVMEGLMAYRFGAVLIGSGQHHDRSGGGLGPRRFSMGSHPAHVLKGRPAAVRARRRPSADHRRSIAFGCGPGALRIVPRVHAQPVHDHGVSRFRGWVSKTLDFLFKEGIN